MTAFLITGVPGSGKSTIALALSDRGYRVIDADDDPELSGWTDGEGTRAPEASMEWFATHEWTWNPSRLNEILEAAGEDHVFVCGAASNQEDFDDCFDKIVLLRVDADTVTDRLEAIDRELGVGDGDGDTRDQIAGWLPDLQNRMLSPGAIAVDATQSVDRVIDDVLTCIGSFSHDRSEDLP